MDTRKIDSEIKMNQWIEVIRECRSSRQSVRSWCIEHDVNDISYYYWIKKLETTSIQVAAIVIRLDSAVVEIQNGATDSVIENTLGAIKNLGDISKAEQIYIACGFTDMSKSIDGLAGMVNFKLNPFQNSLFLFCRRRKDRLKAHYWEGDGFVLLYRHLESSSFQLARDAEKQTEDNKWLLIT